MKRSFFILAIFLLFFPVLIFAQENVFGIVIYADGQQFSIFRQGELLEYDIYQDDIFGLPLLEGDMVQTEDNSFVEIQLLPSETVIKMAENTTFQITSLSEEGGGNFELLYGRVRAQVSRLQNANDFQIRGQTAVAGVRGTDFGFDYVASAASFFSPSASIYCFEGSVEVAEVASDGSTGLSTETGDAESAVLIGAYEMASFSTKTEAETLSTATPIATKSLDTSITNYWQTNTFRAKAIPASEINEVFPELQAKLAMAKSQAAIAAEKRDFLASGKTLGEYQETQAARDAAAQSEVPAVPPYAPVEPVNMAGLLRNVEPALYKPDESVIVGSVAGILGTALEVSGVLITLYGEDWGMRSQIASTLGPALMTTGGVSLTISLAAIFSK